MDILNGIRLFTEVIGANGFAAASRSDAVGLSKNPVRGLEPDLLYSSWAS